MKHVTIVSTSLKPDCMTFNLFLKLSSFVYCFTAGLLCSQARTTFKKGIRTFIWNKRTHRYFLSMNNSKEREASDISLYFLCLLPTRINRTIPHLSQTPQHAALKLTNQLESTFRARKLSANIKLNE